jgi:hypothetical protein
MTMSMAKVEIKSKARLIRDWMRSKASPPWLAGEFGRDGWPDEPSERYRQG